MNQHSSQTIPFEHIHSKLSTVERSFNVKILYACESGSRAWGFPSLDSDFDVRFVYIHDPDWYLSIDEMRDVIEEPLDAENVDLSGWELRKALRLFRKSNPPLMEWLQSPIVYSEVGTLATSLRDLVATHFSPRAATHHYLSMATKNFREYLHGDLVRVKKYFYVLRPLLACRWIESGRGAPPTEFAKLVAATVNEPELLEAIEGLLERKMKGVEVERGPRIEVFNNFIENEIGRLKLLDQPPPHLDSTAALNALFRSLLWESFPME